MSESLKPSNQAKSYADRKWEEAVSKRVFNLETWRALLETWQALVDPEGNNLAVQSWTPSYACNGLMTITGAATAHANFIEIGKLVVYNLRFTGTLVAPASNVVTFTFPTSDALTTIQAIHAWASDGGGYDIRGGDNESTADKGHLFTRTTANWVVGAFEARVFGFYFRS